MSKLKHATLSIETNDGSVYTVDFKQTAKGPIAKVQHVDAFGDLLNEYVVLPERDKCSCPGHFYHDDCQHLRAVLSWMEGCDGLDEAE